MASTTEKQPLTPEDLGQPQSLADAANGQPVDSRGERDALDYLLGATTPLEYDVPVQYDTPAGRKPLTVRLRQIDSATFDRADQEHRTGDGPFARLDVAAFNAAVLAEAIVSIKSGDRVVETGSREFLGGIPSAEAAIALRFKTQPGILDSLVEEVRKISGYGPDRVGSAQRVLVDAAGN